MTGSSVNLHLVVPNLTTFLHRLNSDDDTDTGFVAFGVLGELLGVDFLGVLGVSVGLISAELVGATVLEFLGVDFFGVLGFLLGEFVLELLGVDFLGVLDFVGRKEN